MRVRKRVSRRKVKIDTGKLVKNAAVCLIFVYVAFVLVSQQIELGKNKKQLAEINADIAAREEQRAELELKKELVSTPQYMERLAREKLGFILPDEIVFMDSGNR